MVRTKAFAKSLDLMCEGKGSVMDDCSFFTLRNEENGVGVDQ